MRPVAGALMTSELACLLSERERLVGAWGKKCGAQKTCVDCVAAGDCAAGTKCVNSVCVSGCDPGNHCPTGNVCEVVAGVC